jgi:hypothetical protein
MNGDKFGAGGVHLVNMVIISQFVIFAVPANNATKLD